MFRTILHEIRRIWPLLAVIALSLVIFGDPAQLAVQLYGMSMVALVIIMAHLLRKSLFPYVDMSDVAEHARKSPAGAAIVFGAMIALLSVIILATSARAAVPERAKPHLPVLAETLDRHWPGAPLRHVTAGQVEGESSWRVQATLKTSRELGRGLVQPTIAYHADGSERFNAYREALAKYRELAGWNWESDPFNVRYQLTFLVLRDRTDWTAMRRIMVDDEQAWRAALVCYNAGRGRVDQRRARALATGIPADRWTGGLELAHGHAEQRELYGRPLWQAVNEYPTKIFRLAEKYRGYL